MYHIINDIGRYPDFLPWCVGSEILVASESELVARLDLARGGLSQSFTTRNRLSPPHGVTLELVDGPFTALSGAWALQALGEDGCKISMQLQGWCDHRCLALMASAGMLARSEQTANFGFVWVVSDLPTSFQACLYSDVLH